MCCAPAFPQAREHSIKGNKLDTKAAMPKSMGGAAKLTKKMFVGGTGELTDEDLRDYFSQFGTIDDAAVSSYNAAALREMLSSCTRSWEAWYSRGGETQ